MSAHKPTEEQRSAAEAIRLELGGKSDVERELAKQLAAEALRQVANDER
ncbi:hypothetical protein [Gordonia polyisoprenivorans]|nr:hypothetical protein [Gordonia polyisoprenivorans]WCB35580.1 hypothetical protein PHA63_15820 [Gordonia polyisoprenivorans]